MALLTINKNQDAIIGNNRPKSNLTKTFITVVKVKSGQRPLLNSTIVTIIGSQAQEPLAKPTLVDSDTSVKISEMKNTTTVINGKYIAVPSYTFHSTFPKVKSDGQYASDPSTSSTGSTSSGNSTSSGTAANYANLPYWS